jgi:cyanophycinase
MEFPDRRAIELAGGVEARVRIVPAAAAPDNNHQRAGHNGAQWFRKLGVNDVKVLPLIDRASADAPDVLAAILRSGLIYLLGGFPRYLEESLSGSRGWQAMLEAYQRGAVIAGSSAGAMVLCDQYYRPSARKVVKGLNLLPGTCFLPHHDTFGQKWAPGLTALMPAIVLIGVDEETAILNDGPHGTWTVYGKGATTIYRPSGLQIYRGGETFRLP